MTVGALIDAGAPADAVIGALESLATGARFEVEKTKRSGIAASKFRVHLSTEPQKHRHLSHILKMIDASGIAARAKQNASAVFQKLGQAESTVHGVSIEKVHFHEVGAADSIADIVGACVALDLLNIDEIHCSAINVGSGNGDDGAWHAPDPSACDRQSIGRHFDLRARSSHGIDHSDRSRHRRDPSQQVSGAMPPMRISGIGHGAGGPRL